MLCGKDRDAVMAETIHNDLQMTLLTKESRCGFYVLEAYHVIGEYPNNLPKLLKQKDWILNKVEFPSILRLEEKNSLNNMQLALSQNRFFSTNAELLKPGRLLDDN